MQNLVKNLSPDLPVLIAGPTASGKSAIALEIAAAQGGTIVNADALQVFANWRVLTARPSPADEGAIPHRLYGHIAGDANYSVGQWLRDLTPLLDGTERLIITGGTGLNFFALTEGLADIPQTPTATRTFANERLANEGIAALLAELDPVTAARIDQQNPMRVQRAWEVQHTTGKGLAHWQDNTPPPLLPLANAQTILLDADRDWLANRIKRRFDIMLASGALEEVRENLENWNPKAASSKAIGAAELIAHLQGSMTLETARDSANIATRQYAKRQRTWFRSRMKSWNSISLP
ncbi:MAG: tRNA (adenosine(37)-N6)-dimethylallyltransferase MiaA [Paracoccaceae bacterium]